MNNSATEYVKQLKNSIEWLKEDPDTDLGGEFFWTASRIRASLPEAAIVYGGRCVGKTRFSNHLEFYGSVYYGKSISVARGMLTPFNETIKPQSVAVAMILRHLLFQSARLQDVVMWCDSNYAEALSALAKYGEDVSVCLESFSQVGLTPFWKSVISEVFMLARPGGAPNALRLKCVIDEDVLRDDELWRFAGADALRRSATCINLSVVEAFQVLLSAADFIEYPDPSQAFRFLSLYDGGIDTLDDFAKAYEAAGLPANIPTMASVLNSAIDRKSFMIHTSRLGPAIDKAAARLQNQDEA